MVESGPQVTSQSLSSKLKDIFITIRYRLMNKRQSLKYIDLYLIDNPSHTSVEQLKLTLQSSPFLLSAADAQELSVFVIPNESSENEAIINCFQLHIQPYKIVDDQVEKSIIFNLL